MAHAADKNATKKPKLVRDSFTIPKNEYAAIDALKTRAISLGLSVKKSELLRAGLMALQGLGDAAYKAALAAVPTLKTGRPASEKPAKPAPAKPAKAAKPADTKKPAAAKKPVPVKKAAPAKKAVRPPATKKAATPAPRKTA